MRQLHGWRDAADTHVGPLVVVTPKPLGGKMPYLFKAYEQLKNNPVPDKYKELISEKRIEPILLGDGPDLGGHLYPPAAGKTAFPKDWTPEKIIRYAIEIASDPDFKKWKQKTGPKA